MMASYPLSNHGYSCLSPSVHHLLCDVGVSETGTRGSVLDQEGLILWDALSRLLPDLSTDPIPPEDENEQYFVNCVRSLAPVMSEICTHYAGLTRGTINERLLPYSEWTAAKQAVADSFDVMRTDPYLGPLHTLLLITPVLERALGDVYLLRGHQCPSMIKDLLLTSELRDTLGPTPIHLMRVLIGPPISLNLRNVAWHGFFRPGEVSPRYAYTLLALVLSLGQLLQRRGIEAERIAHRKPVTFPQIHKMVDNLSVLDSLTENIDKELDVIVDSPLIHRDVREIWQRAARAFTQGRFPTSVRLLLPQLELSLRLVYAHANNCQHRVLTAQNSVLFTTFDEILSPYMEDGVTPNKLRNHLTDPLMTLVLDLFMYPEGLRLRDRVSHGETSSGSITRDVAGCVLCLGIALATHVKQEANKTLSDTLQTEKLKEIIFWAGNYTSRFHPISIIKEKILMVAFSLKDWYSVQKPNNHQIETRLDWEAERRVIPEDVKEILDVFVHRYGVHLSWTVNNSLLCPFYDMTEDIRGYLQTKIPTLYRNMSKEKQGNREEELLRIINRFLTQSHLVSEQVVRVANDRYGQFTRKELRSRQRKTYARMLDSLPRLSEGLQLGVVICLIYLYSLDDISQADGKQTTSTISLLKYLLKFVENLKTFTSGDKNRWDEAVDITESMLGRLRESER